MVNRFPGSKLCSVCPPENLCPSGPRPELKMPYDHIIEIITFGQVFQKLVIIANTNTSGNSKKDNIV